MARQPRARFTGHIGPYLPAYLAEIQDFWVTSWTLTMPEIDFEARREWLGAHLEALVAEGTEIRVAVAGDGSLAGFVTIDPTNGHMDQICVAPDWWGCGVSERLLESARAVSPSRLKLDVNADNHRAIAFYKRQHFVETGTDINARSGLPIINMTWTSS
jgi:putative acetyltransferase